MLNLALIPARGGSKRIPKKNIKLLAGKPLIVYTIEAALASKIFAKVIVSTDDPEIAEIAKQAGAELPFIRQASLADDHSPVSLVSLDALNKLDPQNNIYQNIAQLMPNCPLRNENDIKESYEYFLATKSQSQISVTKYGWLNPWWAFKKDAENLEALFPEALKQRSQDLPELVCPSGAIWWAKSNSLRQHKSFHSNDRTGFELPWHRAIDIDDYDDWKMTEVLMELDK